MSVLEDRLRALLAAGPRDAESLAREGLGLSGPGAVIARVAEAALAAAPWAERDGALWKLRSAAAPRPDGVLLLAPAAERVAWAEWRDGRLGGESVGTPADAAAAVRGRAAAAWPAFPGALDVRALCRALDPARAFTAAERAAQEWRLPHHAGDDARGALATLAALWEAALDRAEEQGTRGFDALRALVEAPRPVLDLAPYRFDAAFLATLPEIPGTYRFLDAAGEVFYVGKARNLRNRVGSYFRVPRVPDEKWKTIVARLKEIEFTMLGSELEALLDEHRLIRELRGTLINVQAAAHPRAPRRLPERSAFVLPAASEARAAVWLHRRGEGLKRLEVSLAPRGVAVAAADAAAFFRGGRRTDAEELAIGEAWLGDHQHRLARLDPDAPGFEESLLRVLNGDAFAAGARS